MRRPLVCLVAAGASLAASSSASATIGVCAVPNVKGRTLAVAKVAIVKANCDVGTLLRAYSNTVRKGRVISQSPGPGWVLPPGNQVQLTISRGRRR